MSLDAQQSLAVAMATDKSIRVVLISGGAGFGKTFLAKSICDEYEKQGQRYALCAPTGKAAARLREATSKPTATVHRFLRYNGSVFQADDDALNGMVFLCDESSMLDTGLFSAIVKRNPLKLILIGDDAQLPPVGRGQPYADLLKLCPELSVQLKHSYRATEAVFSAASTIRNGGRPPEFATSDSERWSMVNTGNHKNTQAEILKWVNAGHFDFEQDIILVARNGDTEEDESTVKGLNAAIVASISPRRTGQRFNVGDRVVNTHNMPDIDCWNGTTGTVHAIDQDGGIWVRTDVPVINKEKTDDPANPVYTSHVLFTRDARMSLQLAYAMTVHKSQGSSYRNVCLACFNRDIHAKLLDRSLLYTGVTRTKSACIVVGELSAAFTAIDTVRNKRTIIQELAERGE
jgi:exodeoxyribonuclease V alpha subunit